MSVKEPRRILFNPRPQPTTPADVFIRSSDPVVLLEEAESFRRVPRQGNNLAGKTLVDESPIFGTTLDWAYRKYTVQRLSSPDGAEDRGVVLGSLPSQPLVVQPGQPAAQHPAAQGTLCLFNVLVALEWLPDQDYMRRLMWAFRRASDFLYDVTDGRMAFGQVVFGGTELMDCADIQLTTSNHMHPRAWVDGLHENHKYLPIRLGRGHWPSRNGVCIPWDEPEGYRVIVHEWAHYALGLRDQYVTPPRQVIPARAAGITAAAEQVLVWSEQASATSYSVVITTPATSSESVMASLEGTSELVAQSDGNQRAHKQAEWQTITQRYPWLQPPTHTLQGPGRLPLPLPNFALLGELRAHLRPEEELVLTAEHLPRDITLADYSVYLVRPDLDHPERVSAQGGPDARFADDGLALLGAAVGDTILLAGTTDADTLTMCHGAITEAQERAGMRCAVIDWQPASSGPMPVIDVIADATVPDPQRDAGAVARISVRLQPTGTGAALPDSIEAYLFTPGAAGIRLERDSAAGDADAWWSRTYAVAALDGHILVRWGTHSMLSTFSHGGNPPSSSPSAPVPPITAGSADGNVLLFFYDSTGGRMVNERAEEYGRVKLITTVGNGAQGADPRHGARAMGSAFSLTGNYPLPQEFFPTLLVRYAMPDEHDLRTGDLLVCRLHNGVWQPQPTYTPAGASFAAMPLNEETAARLVAADAAEPRVEHYRLYWVPRE